jgi:hypothetical protein
VVDVELSKGSRSGDRQTCALEIFDLLCQLVEGLAPILTYLLSGKPIHSILAALAMHRKLEERFA